MLNSAKPSIVYIYKWFTSLCRASIYLRFLQKILSNYSFLCHPLVIKFADAEKTKELCRAISKINWAVMMGTISWRLTHSVTPRLRTIIYVSSKILSVFFIKSYKRHKPSFLSLSRHLIIHLIIILMMRDDDTCHDMMLGFFPSDVMQDKRRWRVKTQPKICLRSSLYL